MEFIDVVYGRRSVRSYSPEPVEEDDLTFIIDAAVQAPSAVNEQPWAFHVIRDQQLLTRMSQRAKSYLMERSAEGLRPSPFRDQLAKPDFQIFYNAPVLVLICAVGPSAWSVENCALAAQNLMLAAYSRGLGTCWIGFAEHWLQSQEGRTTVKLPQNHQPVAPIIVGRLKGPIPSIPRRRAVVHWVDGESPLGSRLN